MTGKWEKSAAIYLRFAADWPNLDKSRKAAEAAYNRETHGVGDMDWGNAYMVGKHWQDATVAMWNEDVAAGMLTKGELIDDFPESFVRKAVTVMPGRHAMAATKSLSI